MAVNFHRIFMKTHKLVADNSPAILTAIGVTGTITTAFLTGKATFKAAEIIRDEQEAAWLRPTSRDLYPREKFDLAWKLYIPAVTTGVLTCVCIVSANRIGTRRTAAMAAAYSLSQEAFSEYTHKVVEQFGAKKEQAVRDEIAQDRVTRNPPSQQVLVADADGKQLCFDAFSGRYFRSTVENIRKAQNDINAQVIHSDYATLDEFYEYLGIDGISISTDVGWNNNKLLEINFSSTIAEDRGNVPCLVMTFATVPIRDPHRFPSG